MVKLLSVVSLVTILLFVPLSFVTFLVPFSKPARMPLRSWSLVAHDSTESLKSVQKGPNTTAVATVTAVTWQSKTGLLTSRKCEEKYKLLILVTSEPSGTDRRTSIRRTWASRWHKRKDLPTWKTFFLCGQADNEETREKLLEEDAEHQDIIIGNFTDIFYHLSEKIIMAFEWANQYCSGYDYLMKSDDDVFFNVPNFFKHVRNAHLPTSNLYAGNLVRRAPPFRGGKYGVTEAEFSEKFYPPFMSGGGMFFSQDVTQKMIDKHDPNNYFKLDDVYIGMLAKKIGVRTTRISGLRLYHDPATCKCSKTEISHHKVVNIECMKKLYDCGKDA